MTRMRLEIDTIRGYDMHGVEKKKRNCMRDTVLVIQVPPQPVACPGLEGTAIFMLRSERAAIVSEERVQRLLKKGLRHGGAAFERHKAPSLGEVQAAGKVMVL
ncbi:uncharacterized protein A4U43_UnF11320 [Asparagus officinalis]|uniref:Uncharacterized protein n=1 Tax=Asparagus officinalis TaxID=4686 RepID=A0A1R3L5A0_ASPOF|nr:uncharacterized protein A4U43_UnF11320 [Asparagus officinalis]